MWQLKTLYEISIYELQNLKNHFHEALNVHFNVKPKYNRKLEEIEFLFTKLKDFKLTFNHENGGSIVPT